MDRRYLTDVAPLAGHILQVDFVSGARLLLDMKPYLDMAFVRRDWENQGNHSGKE